MSEKDPTEQANGNEYPSEILAESDAIRERTKGLFIEQGIPEGHAEELLSKNFDTLTIFKTLTVDPDEFVREYISRNPNSGKKPLPEMPHDSQAMQEFREKIKRKLLERGFKEADINQLLKERLDDKTFTKIDPSDTWVQNLAYELGNRSSKKITPDVVKKVISKTDGTPAQKKSNIEDPDEEFPTTEFSERPESITLDSFHEYSKTEDGRSALLKAVTDREKAVLDLRKLYGISKKNVLEELEYQNEIEGWSLYESKTKQLKKEIPNLHKFKKEIIDITWWPEWQRFFEASSRLMRTLGEYARENNLDEKQALSKTATRIERRRGATGKAETEVSNESGTAAAGQSDDLDLESMEGAYADIGSGMPVESAGDVTKQEPLPASVEPVVSQKPSGEPKVPIPSVEPATHKSEGYAWRKGIETFNGDQQYRKVIEDWLDQVNVEIVSDVSESYAGPVALNSLPEFTEFLELSKEIRSMLAVKTKEEQAYGMYGHLTGIEYSDDEKGAIQEKLNRIIAVRDGIYDQFGLRQKTVQSETAKSENAEDEDKEREVPVPELSEWRIKRNEWMTLRGEFEEKLAEFYRAQNDRSTYQKVLGIGKEVPPELVELEEKYRDARKAYAAGLRDALRARKEARESGDTKTEWSFENEGVKAAAAGRFVIDEVRRKLDLQKSVLTPPEKSRFAGLLNKWQAQPQWRKYLGSALLGTTVGLATGGVSSVSGIVWRLSGGVLAGKGAAELASQGVQKLYDGKIAKASDSVEVEKTAIQESFDVESIDVNEGYLRAKEEKLNQLYRNKKIASAAAGVGAAAVVGYAAGSLDVDGGVDAAIEALNGSEGNGSLPSVRESIPAQPPQESVAPIPQSDLLVHKVAQGDTLWNLVESKSEALAELHPADRNTMLTALFDRAQHDPEVLEKIGLRSGDVNRIYINENLNLAPLLEEAERMVAEQGSGDEGFSSLSSGPTGFENENPPEAAAPLQEAGKPLNVASLEDDFAPLAATAAGVAAAQKIGETPPEPDEATLSANLKNTIVSKVEAQQKGFFGLLNTGPDIAGTFDRMKNLTLDQIIALQESDKLEKDLETMGIRREGWDAWIDEVNRMNSTVAADRNETLDAYLTKIVSSNRPSETVSV